MQSNLQLAATIFSNHLLKAAGFDSSQPIEILLFYTSNKQPPAVSDRFSSFPCVAD